nr:hypothetical protein [uncultured Bacteroides sp.]
MLAYDPEILVIRMDHGQIAADAGEEHLPVTVATMLKLLDNPSRS